LKYANFGNIRPIWERIFPIEIEYFFENFLSISFQIRIVSNRTTSISVEPYEYCHYLIKFYVIIKVQSNFLNFFWSKHVGFRYMYTLCGKKTLKCPMLLKDCRVTQYFVALWKKSLRGLILIFFISMEFLKFTLLCKKKPFFRIILVHNLFCNDWPRLAKLSKCIVTLLYDPQFDVLLCQVY
jgi:hypothetical protein